MRITRQAVSSLYFSTSPDSSFDSNILVDSNLGDLVYPSSSEYVRKIDIFNQVKMPAIGMIVERNGDICRIQSSGIVEVSSLGKLPVVDSWWICPICWETYDEEELIEA